MDPGERPLAGRVEELAALTAAVPAIDGPTRVAVVWGEAGSGKSRLLRALLDSLPADVAILRCAGHPDAPMSYGLIQDAVRDYVDSWPAVPPELAGHEDALAAVLGRRWPWLGRAGAQVHRGSVLRAAALLVRGALQGRRGVLAVEDLHWADADSAAALAESVRAGGAGLLVVATVREEEKLAGPVGDAVGVLERHPGTVRLRLTGLSPAGVASLLAEHFQSYVGMPVVTAVRARTDGLPLWIEELLVGVRRPEDLAGAVVSGSIARSLCARLDALPDPCRQVAETAAVLGERVDPSLLAAVCGVESAGLRGALRRLVDEQVLVTREPGGLSFRHALTREVVAGRVLADERRHWHTIAFRTLRSTADDATLAWHAAGAGLDPEAASAAHRAARAALSVGSGYEALRLAELALRMRPADALLQELAARAAYLAGLYDVAEQHATAWDASVQEPADRAEAACLLARLRWHVGDRAGQWRQLRAALDSAGDGPCTPTLARVYAAYANAFLRSEEPAEAVRWADRALVAAERTGAADVRRSALTDKGSALLNLDRGRTAHGLALLDEATSQALAAGDLDTVGRAVNNGLDARLDGVPPAAAWRVYDDAWALLTGLGSETALGKVVRHGVDLAERTGQWQRGWDIVTDRLPVETDAVERVVLGAKAAFLALERGNDDDAVRLFDRVTAGAHGMDQYWARIYQALLDVAVSARLLGPGEALRALTRYRAAVSPAEHQARAYRAVQAGMWALDSGVTPGQVRGFLAAIGVRAENPGSRSVFAHLDCALLEAEGRIPAAIEAGQLAIVGRGAVAAWQADAHTRLGRCLLRAGRRAPARTEIQTAVDLLTEWPGWRRRAAQAVAARLDAPERELTDREGAIAVLVAQALTNQEIADRLGISARTVAVHVSRILTKTGSRSRTELAVSTLRGMPQWRPVS